MEWFYIKVLQTLKKLSPRQRQWLWFVGLWCGGLAAVMFLAYLIRLAMGIN